VRTIRITVPVVFRVGVVVPMVIDRSPPIHRRYPIRWRANPRADPGASGNEDAFATLPDRETDAAKDEEVMKMATRKQTAAAKRNIKKARTAAERQRTIAHLPAAVRKDMGRQAARARARGGKPGRGLEDRTRQQLYDEAKRRSVPGRSRMGKWDLVEALRKTR
jgi:hypothetical protein